MFEYEPKEEDVKAGSFRDLNTRHKKLITEKAEETDKIEVNCYDLHNGTHPVGVFYTKEIGIAMMAI